MLHTLADFLEVKVNVTHLAGSEFWIHLALGAFGQGFKVEIWEWGLELGAESLLRSDLGECIVDGQVDLADVQLHMVPRCDPIIHKPSPFKSRVVQGVVLSSGPACLNPEDAPSLSY